MYIYGRMAHEKCTVLSLVPGLEKRESGESRSFGRLLPSCHGMLRVFYRGLGI